MFKIKLLPREIPESQYYSEFGKDIALLFNEAHHSKIQQETVLTSFLNEIEKHVTKDLYIVLDDYHLIQDNVEINDSVIFLLNRLSPLIHLIIISRTDTELPVSRIRAMRETLEINETDLVFTIPEIEQLYRNVFHISIETENLKTLYLKTDGWVSGLILFYHLLRGKTPDEIDNIISEFGGSSKIISGYLEENVFNLQSDEVKSFLIHTSILTLVDTDFCDKLLSINSSSEILQFLEENHLFTYPFDTERKQYYYHHLFRDFLQTKQQLQLNQNQLRKLNNDIARLYEAEQKNEEAINHYIAAENYEKSCDIIDKIGVELFLEGRMKRLLSYLNIIPDDYLDAKPDIHFLIGKALLFAGKSQEAMGMYKKALAILSEQKSTDNIAKYMSDIGYYYYNTGDYRSAEKVFQDLLIRIPEHSDLYFGILGLLITVSSYLGKLDIADQYYKKAEDLLAFLEELPENIVQISLSEDLKTADLKAIGHLWLTNNLINRYLISGDFDKALELSMQNADQCINLKYTALLQYTYLQISDGYFFKGDFKKGLEYAQKSLTIIRESGSLDGFYAANYHDIALNCLFLGRISKAIDYANKGLSLLQDSENRNSKGLTYHVLFLISFKTGDIQAAENAVKAGLKTIEGLSNPFTEGRLKADYAELLIEKGQFTKVPELLSEAEKNLKASKFHSCKILCLSARFHWEQNQTEVALDKLASGLKIARAKNYDIWIALEKNWIMPLLVTLFSQGKMKAYVQNIFNKIGKDSFNELNHLQKDKNPETSNAAIDIFKKIPKPEPSVLNIICLGKFSVFLGEDKIPASQWKNSKVKKLFQYLVVARNRGYIQKEVLIELLWPEEDFKITVKRFNVTLNLLRKILEPDLSRGTTSSYILKQGNAYKLHFGKQGSVDIDAFQHEIKLAKIEKESQDAIQHYLKAESIYQGELLEENRYDEWCFDERERLKEIYLDLLVKIMENMEEQKAYSECIQYANKYLNIDKYAENIYQRLMGYYSLIGNKAMVKKTFEKCKTNISEDLDCSLSKKTEMLFKDLL